MNEREKTRWEKKQERIKRDSDYRWSTYNSVKDLSHDWIPQKKLVPEVRKMLARTEAVFKKIPSLNGLTLKDSLKRDWEIDIDRGDEKGNITEDGEIFMISAYRDRDESINISLLKPGFDAGVSYHLMFWPDSEDYGNPRNNAIALKLAKERFGDLFEPLEKALGLRAEGEPLSMSR